MQRSSLKETQVVHETDNLQMNIYYNHSNVYCHWHDEYEFVYATGGECECIADGIPYVLHEGELALIGGVIEQLVGIIHSEYRGEIDLDMLSKRSNYSKSYIIRLFKRHTGKTPVEYINSYRISKSLDLLSNTDMSVLVIGLEVGFENAAYFIKLFKKQMGVTPLRWRNCIK